MWTAVVLGSTIVGVYAAYALWAAAGRAGRCGAVAVVLAAPLAYLALPFLFTCIWMAFGWWWRAPAPAEVALSFRQKLRLFGNEFASLARSPLRMTFYWLLRDPPPARR